MFSAQQVERREQKVKLMKKVTDAVVEEFGAAAGSVTLQIRGSTV